MCVRYLGLQWETFISTGSLQNNPRIFFLYDQQECFSHRFPKNFDYKRSNFADVVYSGKLFSQTGLKTES